MKIYEGVVTRPFNNKVHILERDGVTEDGTVRYQRRLLPMQQALRNHSPSGLAWGYRGSGPAQLALALLCDVVDERDALLLYQEYRDQVIARLPLNASWRIAEDQVRYWHAMMRETLPSDAASGLPPGSAGDPG